MSPSLQEAFVPARPPQGTAHAPLAQLHQGEKAGQDLGSQSLVGGIAYPLQGAKPGLLCRRNTPEVQAALQNVETVASRPARQRSSCDSRRGQGHGHPT